MTIASQIVPPDCYIGLSRLIERKCLHTIRPILGNGMYPLSFIEQFISLLNALLIFNPRRRVTCAEGDPPPPTHPFLLILHLFLLWTLPYAFRHHTSSHRSSPHLTSSHLTPHHLTSPPYQPAPQLCAIRFSKVEVVVA